MASSGPVVAPADAPPGQSIPPVSPAVTTIRDPKTSVAPGNQIGAVAQADAGATKLPKGNRPPHGKLKAETSSKAAVQPQDPHASTPAYGWHVGPLVEALPVAPINGARPVLVVRKEGINPNTIMLDHGAGHNHGEPGAQHSKDPQAPQDTTQPKTTLGVHGRDGFSAKIEANGAKAAPLKVEGGKTDATVKVGPTARTVMAPTF